MIQVQATGLYCFAATQSSTEKDQNKQRFQLSAKQAMCRAIGKIISEGETAC